jgi:hypothetical protein
VHNLRAQHFFKISQVPSMRNVYEVLRQKELELAKLEKEVEALRVAAPLLSDDKEVADIGEAKASTSATAAQQPIRIPQPVAAAAQPTARAVGWEDNSKRWP